MLKILLFIKMMQIAVLKGQLFGKERKKWQILELHSFNIEPSN